MTNVVKLFDRDPALEKTYKALYDCIAENAWGHNVSTIVGLLEILKLQVINRE